MKPVIIQEAIERVERERSLVSTERCYFRTFRTAVSQATVDNTDTSVETIQNLRETYRETVMNIPDFETTYDESLKENLKEELSPSSAEVLLSNAPLTQKRKRDLLIETNIAIERREQLLTQLSHEKESLERTFSELVDINESVEELPEDPLDQCTFEEVLDIWERYDVLQQRCKQLLEERQREIHQRAENVQVGEKEHIVNKYLYEDLRTPYPVLSAIATTCEVIQSRRDGDSFDWTVSAV
jgi:hypothetical protein